MNKLLLLSILIFTNSTFAASQAKTALMNFNLASPMVRVSFPMLDLKKVDNKKCRPELCYVQINQDLTLAIGNEIYVVDSTAEFLLKPENKTLAMNIDLIEWIRYRLISQQTNTVVGSIAVNLQNGDVIAGSAKGKVLAWY